VSPQSRVTRRALAAARRRGDSVGGAGRRSGAAWPSRITHAELDELAAKAGVTFAEGASKPDKQAALTAAGVTPEG
jgi:hypothetical protein